MFRTSITYFFLLVPIASVSAHGGGGGGHGGSGGGGRGLVIGPLGVQFYPQGSNAGGFVPPGFHGSPGFPLFGFWGGYGAGWPYYFENDYYVFPQYDSRIDEPQPNVVNMSGEFPATIHLELPAAGEVWVNGDKGEGKPMKEWTLTSPVLKPNAAFTFDVTARWVVEGKTYECNRVVSVTCGSSSRLRVLSGTQVK